MGYIYMGYIYGLICGYMMGDYYIVSMVCNHILNLILLRG